MADLNTDVRYIKGIGEAKAKALGKLGIFTLGDLIGSPAAMKTAGRQGPSAVSFPARPPALPP